MECQILFFFILLGGFFPPWEASSHACADHHPMNTFEDCLQISVQRPPFLYSSLHISAAWSPCILHYTSSAREPTGFPFPMPWPRNALKATPEFNKGSLCLFLNLGNSALCGLMSNVLSSIVPGFFPILRLFQEGE